MPIHEHPSSVHRHAIMLEVVLLQLWIGERMTIVSNILASLGRFAMLHHGRLARQSCCNLKTSLSS